MQPAAARCRLIFYAGSIMLSTIFADESTPGNPAPGCVPAPTKYKFSKSSERLCGRNHADCVKIGSTENAEPR